MNNHSLLYWGTIFLALAVLCLLGMGCTIEVNVSGEVKHTVEHDHKVEFTSGIFEGKGK